MTTVRRRPGALLTALVGPTIALAALAGCGNPSDASKKEAPVPETTEDRPYLFFDEHIPTAVAKDVPFRLIYLGGTPTSADFNYTTPPPGETAAGFRLDIGESHTAAGYTFRLIALVNGGARLAVTDPSGKRIGF